MKKQLRELWYKKGKQHIPAKILQVVRHCVLHILIFLEKADGNVCFSIERNYIYHGN